MHVYGCIGISLLPLEKYGKDRPTRLPGSDNGIAVADMSGTALTLHTALSVVRSGTSPQSFGVIEPITIELRTIIELLPNT
jgi:hypothetical protein